MQTAVPIWSRFRLCQLSAAFVLLMFSASGSAQAPPDQKHEATGEATKTIEYKNADYGFRLTLPESWKGYRILWSKWEGRVLRDDGSVARQFRGPELRFRHPRWTEEHPREDMPIMIFTIAEWNESPVVSAAPMGPAELGRNKRYVFAVPPRWDYDFAEGWEEAQRILTSDSLHIFAPSK